MFSLDALQRVGNGCEMQISATYAILSTAVSHPIRSSSTKARLRSWDTTKLPDSMDFCT